MCRTGRKVEKSYHPMDIASVGLSVLSDPAFFGVASNARTERVQQAIPVIKDSPEKNKPDDAAIVRLGGEESLPVTPTYDARGRLRQEQTWAETSTEQNPVPVQTAA